VSPSLHLSMTIIFIFVCFKIVYSTVSYRQVRCDFGLQLALSTAQSSQVPGERPWVSAPRGLFGADLPVLVAGGVHPRGGVGGRHGRAARQRGAGGRPPAAAPARPDAAAPRRRALPHQRARAEVPVRRVGLHCLAQSINNS
jgi:hypothetical protein